MDMIECSLSEDIFNSSVFISFIFTKLLNELKKVFQRCILFHPNAMRKLKSHFLRDFAQHLIVLRQQLNCQYLQETIGNISKFSKQRHCLSCLSYRLNWNDDRGNQAAPQGQVQVQNSKGYIRLMMIRIQKIRDKTIGLDPCRASGTQLGRSGPGIVSLSTVLQITGYFESSQF